MDSTVQMAKDDFNVTTDTVTPSHKEAYQTPVGLLGTVLEKKDSPDLNKLLANYYKMAIKPIATLSSLSQSDVVTPNLFFPLAQIRHFRIL